jgi:predicted HicB family RNase H-like nuclease
MPKNDQHQAADAEQSKLEALKRKLFAAGADRDAKKRRAVEKSQRKIVGDKRALRQTGRDALFNFRADGGLHNACKEAASAKGMKLAEWMEVHLVEALETEGRDTAFLQDTGSKP